jgi:hypothetical protein
MSAASSRPARRAASGAERERPRLERGWRMVDEARALFAGALPEASLPASWRDARRGFTAVDYLGLLLIGLFNPAVRTLRGLCAATALPRLQRQWGCGPMPLASVSDAQHLVDPAFLLPVIEELQQRMQAQSAREALPAGSARSRLREAGFALKITDSSVLAALPKMLWAAYGAGRPRGDGKTHQAVRFHLCFDALSATPEKAVVTAGKICERKVWRTLLASAAAPDAHGAHDAENPVNVHIGDRNYGSDFTLLEELTAKGLHFLVRLRIHEHPEVVEELPVSAEDRAGGIVRQAWVRLGAAWRRPAARRRAGQNAAAAPDLPPAVRVIWIERENQTVVLATDLPVSVLRAALAGEMYRERWQVEFFFRWMKCLLGCGHWLAQSEGGVTLQLYLVMVAALLLQLRCGRRPTRRMLELLQFYFDGQASAEDLARGLERAAREAEKAARSKRLYAQKKAAKKQ